MKVIRYSTAFKLQAVREVENGESCAKAVQRKYSIRGQGTVMRWVRQFGSGRYGKIIRVEKANEVNEGVRLRSQLRQAKEALADAHMELALEKAFLEVACEQMDQTVEGFKKKHGGRPRTGRSKPTRNGAWSGCATGRR
jgi:transposase-like protein